MQYKWSSFDYALSLSLSVTLSSISVFGLSSCVVAPEKRISLTKYIVQVSHLSRNHVNFRKSVSCLQIHSHRSRNSVHTAWPGYYRGTTIYRDSFNLRWSSFLKKCISENSYTHNIDDIINFFSLTLRPNILFYLNEIPELSKESGVHSFSFQVRLRVFYNKTLEHRVSRFGLKYL